MTPDLAKLKDLVERAEIKSGMLKMGEPIAFGSDAAIIDELLDALHAANARVKELEAKLRNSMMIAGKRTDLEATAFAMVHTEKHNPNNPVKVLP